MSFNKPKGVILITLFLLLNSLGYLVAALLYLNLLHNPLLFILPSLDSIWQLYIIVGWPLSDNWILIIDSLKFYILQRSIIFLNINWLLIIQVIFYLLLSPLIIIVTLNLFKIKKWARTATIIYSILYLFFTFMPISPFFSIPFTDLRFDFFDINSFMAILLFGSRESSLQRVPALLFFFGLLISLLFGILILVYLFSDVKYKFEKIEAEPPVTYLKYRVKPLRSKVAEKIAIDHRPLWVTALATIFILLPVSEIIGGIAIEVILTKLTQDIIRFFIYISGFTPLTIEELRFYISLGLTSSISAQSYINYTLLLLAGALVFSGLYFLAAIDLFQLKKRGYYLSIILGTLNIISIAFFQQSPINMIPFSIILDIISLINLLGIIHLILGIVTVLYLTGKVRYEFK